MYHIELIDTASRLAELVERLFAAPLVAVDVESNGFFRYQERVCLVQLASGDNAWVIDPLAINDLQPLGSLLASRSVTKLFHAAGNDIRSIYRDWGYDVRNLFDTSIAAAFVGSTQLGMQAVLKEYAGVELPKLRDLQRSDWGLRPLRAEALDYAASDVLHLARARGSLIEHLEELGRLEWVLEECERLEEVRYAPTDRDMAFLSTKGSHSLDGAALAVLRCLYEFRDQEAQHLDRPPFKVFPDSALVYLSEDPTSELATVKGLGRYAHPPGSRALQQAINRGVMSDPVQRPGRERKSDPLTPEDRKVVDVRLRTLKAWRSQLGEELGLNPGLLWPVGSLERLARCPTLLAAEVAGRDVRHWQGREFGSSMQRVLEDLG